MFGAATSGAFNTTTANSQNLETLRHSGFLTSNDMSVSPLDKELLTTNYQSALEWGRLGVALKDAHSYQKRLKAPTIHYSVSRPSPVVLNEIAPPADKALLPLVSHRGAFASKMKWDDKGTFHIKKSKTPRFNANSFYGEKPFLKNERPSPRPVPSPDFGFERSPSHIFPGLKRALDPVYLSDKKALFKKIIQGKERVSSFRDLLSEQRKEQNRSMDMKARKNQKVAPKIKLGKPKPLSVDIKF